MDTEDNKPGAAFEEEVKPTVESNPEPVENSVAHIATGEDIADKDEAPASPDSEAAGTTVDQSGETPTKKQKKLIRKITKATEKLEESIIRAQKYHALLEDVKSRMTLARANLKKLDSRKDQKMLKKELAAGKSLLKSLKSRRKKAKNRVDDFQTIVDKLRSKIPI